MCPLESLGIAMATYSGQNYGAGKPKRIWLGIKASVLMMVIYCGFMFVVLMLGARTFALLFVDPAEWEILKDTELFFFFFFSFFPVLGLLCILRYSIQGWALPIWLCCRGYRNDCPYNGQSLCSTNIGLFSCLFW